MSYHTLRYITDLFFCNRFLVSSWFSFFNDFFSDLYTAPPPALIRGISDNYILLRRTVVSSTQLFLLETVKFQSLQQCFISLLGPASFLPMSLILFLSSCQDAKPNETLRSLRCTYRLLMREVTTLPAPTQSTVLARSNNSLLLAPAQSPLCWTNEPWMSSALTGGLHQSHKSRYTRLLTKTYCI